MNIMNYLNASLKLGKVGKLEQGVAAVEMALLLIPLLLIVAGIVEFGRTFWYYDALTKTTRDGARMMATADKDHILNMKADVIAMAVAAANNAQVSPLLEDDNVHVECLSSSYSVQACVDGTAPVNVRVSIVDFKVDIGSWIPFVTSTIPWSATLSPSTTMRYLCSGAGQC